MLTSIFVAVFCGFVVSNAEGRVVLRATTQIKVNDNEPNIIGCFALYMSIDQCISVGNGLPDDSCSSKKSPTFTCVENAYNTYYKTCPYKLITRVADSFIENLKNSDKILCTDKLYKKFEENMWCWTIIRKVACGFFQIGKGMLTKDGCGTLKLHINMMKTAYPGVCADLTDKYLTPLYKKTACG